MIDLVQYRFRNGTYKGVGARGYGRIKSKGEFLDSSVLNPYNRSESIIFYAQLHKTNPSDFIPYIDLYTHHFTSHVLHAVETSLVMLL